MRMQRSRSVQLGNDSSNRPASSSTLSWQTRLLASLRLQLVHVMFDARPIAVIDEASRHSRRHPGALVHLAKQHAAGVGADAPTIEASGDQTSSQGVKLKLLASTLCLQGCFLHVWPKRLIAQPLCHRKQPFSGTDQITVYFLYTFPDTRRATPPRHRSLGVGQASDVRARLGAPDHASTDEGG